MAEASAAIGVVSFAFQLLAGCVQGFTLLSTAGGIGKVGTEFICLLNIQEARLIEWAQRSGLLQEPACLDKRLNGKLVEEILGHLDGLLRNVDKLTSRYRFTLTTTATTNQQGTSQVSGPSAAISLVSNSTRQDILLRAGLIKTYNALPKRLWWAAVDLPRFREYIGSIQTFVEELWKLLDPLVQQDMLREMEERLIRAIHRSCVVEEAQTLQNAIALDAESSGRETALISVADLRNMRLRAGDLSNEPAATIARTQVTVAEDYLLAFDSVSEFLPLDQGSDIGMVKWNGRECFAEFRRTPLQAAARAIILKRAKNLVKFLVNPKHTAFRTLRCFGVAIAPDEMSMYFLFELPRSGNRPLSLLELLSSRHSLLSSVNARIRLAERLLEAFIYILASGWLHRNMRSGNILFFTSSKNSHSFELEVQSSPYIVGFAYARLDDDKYSEGILVTEPDKDIYQHPRYLSKEFSNYQPFMDVYSLGVVLLEIGVWSALRHIVKPVVNVKTQLGFREMAEVPTYLEQKILDKRDLTNLAHRMGNLYANVALQLLRVQQQDTEHLLDMLKEALNNLQKCNF